MKKNRIQLLVGLLITAVCLYLVFRNIEWKELWAVLARIRYWWAIPCCLVTFLSFYFRAIRWTYLLEPIVGITPRKLFPTLMIGFALNSILPARAGEFARTYLIARDYKVKFSSVFATLVVERIVDGIGLLVMFVVILAFVPIGQDLKGEWKGITIDAVMLKPLVQKLLIVCLALLAATILMLWQPFRQAVHAAIARLPLLPRKAKDSVSRVIDSFVHGFHSLRSPRLVFWVIVHTATTWLTIGWSLVIMSYGFPAMHMNMLQSIGVMVTICIAISIPGAPGYWGLYEAGGILALKILGVVPVNDTEQALGFSLFMHFLQTAISTMPGLWFLWRRQVKLAELTAPHE
ncbi:flippase-like domain-containing protein [Candidatus Sumerlaeota bacterium]|nr:flippase-like domain-containing protein [Candidatus Sumerlaeota bacterium]